MAQKSLRAPACNGVRHLSNGGAPASLMRSGSMPCSVSAWCFWMRFQTRRRSGSNWIGPFRRKPSQVWTATTVLIPSDLAAFTISASSPADEFPGLTTTIDAALR